MMVRCIATALLIRYESTVSRPACAYLLDHLILGKAILPGAAMIEASANASRSTLSPGSFVLDDKTIVSSASILVPLALASPSSNTNVTLITEVDPQSDRIVQNSRRSTFKETSKHFNGSLGHCATTNEVVDVSVATTARKLCSVPPHRKVVGVALAAMQQNAFHSNQAGQHFLHPALLDNSMQTCASLIGVSAREAPNRTGVPVGMQACMLCRGMWQTQAWASASVAALMSDGSVTCDIDLIFQPKLAQSTQVRGMLFKPAARIIEVTVDDVQSTASVQHNLYEIHWEVTHVRTHEVTKEYIQQKSSIWQGLDANKRVQWQNFVKSSTIFATAANGLHLVQALEDQTAMRLINTIHAPPLVGQASLPQLNSYVHNAALVGLLRVASKERSTTHWHHILRSPYDPKWRMDDPLLQQADACGLCMEGGSWYLPVLKTIRLEGINNQHPSIIFEHTKATVVIGGLGGIGSVLATYMVANHLEKPLLLISRSGRHKDSAPGYVAQTEGRLSLSRCDAACSEDMALMASGNASHQYPLQSIVHAGGVVEDRRINDQVSCPSLSK